MIEKGQLYTKNGKDFRVHDVRDGQVFGVFYYAKDRGNVDAETCDYDFRRMDIELFLSEKAELVEVSDAAA